MAYDRVYLYSSRGVYLVFSFQSKEKLLFPAQQYWHVFPKITYTVSYVRQLIFSYWFYIMDSVGFISSDRILGNIWCLIRVILMIAIVLHSDFDSAVLFLALSALFRKSNTMLNTSGKNEKLFPGPDHEGISVLCFTTE